MIRRLGIFFSDWAQKWIPDPFIFALILTFFALLFGWILTESSFFQVVQYWAEGFWELLTFGMQMCLILVTGHALATSSPVQGLINRLARIPRTPGGAAAAVAAVAVFSGLINWGLGIVVGAFYALEVGRQAERKGLKLHYPLIGAAGYSGLVVWHGGWSGSIPLLIATPGHFLEKEIGIIPVSQTLLSPVNLVITGIFLFLIPGLFFILHPRGPGRITPVPEPMRISEKPVKTVREKGIISGLEAGPWLSLPICILGFSYLIWYFIREGLSLNINIMNFLFLFLGIGLHWTPGSYLQAVAKGTRACAGVILQFPFYAGIMGIMKSSGLILVISGWFAQVSNSLTYPIWTFFSAGIVNLFVPSGGGQWAVQGPVMVQTAGLLDFSFSRTALAVAYGDEWTNMFQPFWALPLLGITGLKARDIMGYTIMVMIFTAPVFILALWLSG